MPSEIQSWKIPPLRDPRWTFAGLLALYAIAGCTILDFNRAPLQIVLTVLTCITLEVVFARLLRREWLFPLSATITGLGLSLLVRECFKTQNTIQSTNNARVIALANVEASMS